MTLYLVNRSLNVRYEGVKSDSPDKFNLFIPGFSLSGLYEKELGIKSSIIPSATLILYVAKGKSIGATTILGNSLNTHSNFS